MSSAPRRDPAGSDQGAASGAAIPSRRRHAVFVNDFLHLERSFDELAAELLDQHGEWREVAARSARRQRFEAVIGEARRGEASVIVPLRLEPAAFEHLLPWLDADIELLEAGEGYSRISVSGRYLVPLSQLGAALDRVALHRVAETAVRRFLSEIADALGSRRQPDSDLTD